KSKGKSAAGVTCRRLAPLTSMAEMTEPVTVWSHPPKASDTSLGDHVGWHELAGVFGTCCCPLPSAFMVHSSKAALAVWNSRVKAILLPSCEKTGSVSETRVSV